MRLTLPILIVIGAMGVIGPLGTDMYLPALPAMASELSTTPAWVQLTLTAFSVGLALGQLLLGTLSDRFGRRRLLTGGIALLLVSGIVCSLAPTVEVLIAGRVLMGISGASGIVIGRAIAADLTTGTAAARVFSLLGTIAGVGPIAGPLLGGVVFGWGGWRPIFWVITAFAALLLIGVLLFIRETLPRGSRHRGGFAQFGRTAGAILARRHFLGYAMTLWFSFGAMFAYISASPFVIQRVLGFSPTAFTVVFAINAAGLVSTGLLSAWLAGRVRVPNLATFGLGYPAPRRRRHCHRRGHEHHVGVADPALPLLDHDRDGLSAGQLHSPGRFRYRRARHGDGHPGLRAVPHGRAGGPAGRSRG